MSTYEKIDSVNLESPISENLVEERRIRELKFLNTEINAIKKPIWKDVKDLLVNGEFGIARHIVLEWMKANPDDEWGFEIMALIESYEGNSVTSWMWCANLLDKFPENNIGLCLRKIREFMELNKFEDAQIEIEKLQKIDPGNVFAIMSNAIIYQKQGMFHSAAKCWEKLLTGQKLTQETKIMGLKIIYRAKGYEFLREILIDEVGLEDCPLVLKELLVRSMYNLMLSEECIEQSDKILDIYQDNEIALRLKSRSLLRLGKLSDSIHLLKIYCKNYPKSVSAWESLIEAYMRMDRVDDSIEVWKGLKSLISDDIEILFTAIEVTMIFHWRDKTEELIIENEGYIRSNNFAITRISELFLKIGDIGNSWSFLEKYGINPRESDLVQRYDEILKITQISRDKFLDFDMQNSSIWIPELVTKKILDSCKNRKEIISDTPKCHLISSSLNRGGAERQVALTMKYISENSKFDCSLVVHSLKNNRGKGTYVDELSNQKDRIFQLDEICDDELSSIKDLVGEFGDLLSLLNNTTRNKILRLIYHFSKHSPDVVHAWQDDTILTCSLAAAITGIPKIIGSARSLRPDMKTNLHIRKRPYLRNCFKEIFDDSAHVLSTNSIAGKNSYSDWIEMDPDKIYVVENGVDFSEMERKMTSETNEKMNKFGIDIDDFFLGGVFRLEAGKRPELWLQVLNECRSRGYEFKGILVGGGKMEDTIEKWIEKLNLQDIVYLIGESQDVVSWLEIMNIFLFTSLAEGLPNVVIEAQGFALPVVSTDVGGVGEIVLDGETGILVDSSDPVKIADSVIKIYDEFDIEKMGKEARNMARERFSVASMVDKTGEMYSLVISSGE